MGRGSFGESAAIERRKLENLLEISGLYNGTEIPQSALLNAVE